MERVCRDCGHTQKIKENISDKKLKGEYKQ